MKIILYNTSAALFFLVSAVHAATPEQLAEKYYQHIDNDQWGQVADMLHPSALSDFKANLLPLLKSSSRNGKSGLLKKTFGKDATYEVAANSSDKEFFINFVGNVAGLIRTTGIKNTQLSILGKISETRDVIHVLVRESYKLGDIEIANMEVLTFRKSTAGWSLLLSGKLLGLVQTLQTSTYQLRHRK